MQALERIINEQKLLMHLVEKQILKNIIRFNDVASHYQTGNIPLSLPIIKHPALIMTLESRESRGKLPLQ